MRILQATPDGGRDSPVRAYFLFEIKGLCSVALLRFNSGSRDNFHSHAFNAWTWFLRGSMYEERVYRGQGIKRRNYKFSLKPKFTSRHNLHRVVARCKSWCLTIRGPWSKTWTELTPDHDTLITLTHGRKIVKTEKYRGR